VPFAADSPCPFAIAGLHVLTGDQGEQPDRVGRFAIEGRGVDRVEHGEGVSDQRGDELLAGLLVVPDDARFAGSPR
jgi:hypothetical protein